MHLAVMSSDATGDCDNDLRLSDGATGIYNCKVFIQAWGGCIPNKMIWIP